MPKTPRRSRPVTVAAASAVALAAGAGGLFIGNVVRNAADGRAASQGGATILSTQLERRFAPESGDEALAPEAQAFLDLLSGDSDALEVIDEAWTGGASDPLLAFAVDILHMMGWRRSLESRAFVVMLEQKTGADHGFDIDAWYHFIWEQDYEPHPDYADFKARLYRAIDPRFEGYFDNDRRSDIRLDEVRWGGVGQDGIPPLRGPEMIEAADAGYLSDTDVVFGIEINGDARAYPNRILAWHEMFVDTVGGVPVCGVYCTLCGTVIIYDTVVGGERYHLGTSGFLYRSNKLMYDRDTQSLWNTLQGTPVIGPLAEAGDGASRSEPIVLPRRSVVTTTWGEWKRRHPDTTVLSLETGHRRDYREGAAYREYFATDELMFTVQNTGAIEAAGLPNKREVVGLIFPESGSDTLAIDTEFLSETPVYRGRLGVTDFIILTDRSGANRVYEAPEGFTITGYDGNVTAMDSRGDMWTLTEAMLTSSSGAELERLPSQRAFWFGWKAAFEDVELITGG